MTATPAQRTNGIQVGVNDQNWYVAAFGALGGGADDTTAIQAAITFAQAAGAGSVHLMNSTSFISAPLTLTTAPLRIVGAGFAHSILKASASINAVFQFSDAAENLFFQFSDFAINGNTLASYGIISSNIAHSSFTRLRIQQTNTAAIAIGGGGGSPNSGFCNKVNFCEIANNIGDGIQLTGAGGSTNNIINIIQSEIFLNGGIGINAMSGGAGLNISSSTIETNATAGIYLQALTQSARIVGNYFERNGTPGIAFMSPTSKLVKADILVNGSTVATSMSAAFPSKAIEISGNNSLATAGVTTTVSSTIASGDTTANVASTAGFTSSGWLQIDGEFMTYTGVTSTSFTGLTRGLHGTAAASHSSSATVSPRQDAFVYLIGANGVRIENNVLLDTLRPLVGTTFQGLGASRVTGVNLSSNFVPTGGLLFGGQDTMTSLVSTNNAADWYADSVPKKNYFSQVPQDNGIIVSNTNPTTISLSSVTYNGEVVAEFAATSGSTDAMGQSFNLANYPELAGQLVYFAAYVQVVSAGTEGVALYATGPGYNNSSFIADTNWHLLQQIVQMPASGTVVFGFEKFGAASKAYIARPVLALVGAPYQGFVSAPTTLEVPGNLSAFGPVSAIGVPATSGGTLQGSNAVLATGHYWNGSVSVPYSAGFTGAPTSTGPAGQMVFQVGGTNEWLMNSSHILKHSSSGYIFATGVGEQVQVVAGAATTTIAPASGGVVLLNLVSATNVTALTVSNSSLPVDGQMLEIHVVQPASGTPATVVSTWTNVSFAGGAAPSFTSTLGHRDIIRLRYVNATTKWYEVSRSLNLTS